MKIQISVEGFYENPEKLRDMIPGEELIPIIDLPIDGSLIAINQKVLLKTTQRLSRYASQSDHSLEKIILRMDALVEGMKLVKEIPVELVGIRSYDLEYEFDKGNEGINFGLVVRTQSRANGKIIQGKAELLIL